MLRKLIKHEIIGTYRNYFTIYLGSLLLSISMGLISVIDDSDLTNTFTFLVWIAFLIGGSTVLIIQAIKMYSNSLYSSQGYLSLTLPVKTWQLLLSKVLAMLFWFFVTYLVFSCSYFIFYSLMTIKIDHYLFSPIEFIKSFEPYLNTSAITLPLFFINIVLQLFYTVVLIGLAITSVSTGWLRKGKWAIAVVIYFILSYISNTFSMQIYRILGVFSPSTVLGGLNIFNSLYETYEILLCSIVANLILGAIAFYTTVWLIDNKIEIE